jgi:anti-sigma factor RsiW
MNDLHPFREQLGPYLLDRLDDLDRARVHRHLDGCRDCRREVEELAALVELLDSLDGDVRAAVQTAEPAEPDDDGGRDDDAGGAGLPGWWHEITDAALLGQPSRSETDRGAPRRPPTAPPDLVERLLAEDSTAGRIDASSIPRTGRSAGRWRPRWSRRAVATAASIAAGAAVAVGGTITVGALESTPAVASAELAPPSGSGTGPHGRLELAADGRGSDVSLHVTGAVPGTACVLLLQTRDGGQQTVAVWVADPRGEADVRTSTDLSPSDVPRVVVETVEHQVLLSGTITER